MSQFRLQGTLSITWQILMGTVCERAYLFLCFSGQQMQIGVCSRHPLDPFFLPTINFLRHRERGDPVPFFNHSPSKDGMNFDLKFMVFI